ncbi:hypothetical protein GTY41_31585, partial [Streptomyces sp. SID685]|nr:hypothetical protein [Streptomyces sp. SID685]
MTSLPPGSDQGGSAERPVPLVCARCGVPAPAPHPATWTCSVEDGAARYFCAAC